MHNIGLFIADKRLQSPAHACRAILARPAAILWDEEEWIKQGKPSLIYVMRQGAPDRKGKIVVRLDFAVETGAKRTFVRTNSVRTAGTLPAGDLGPPRYLPVEGKLE